MSSGGVFKMKNKWDEDTRDQSKERQKESPQDVGGEWHPDEYRFLVAKYV